MEQHEITQVPYTIRRITRLDENLVEDEVIVGTRIGRRANGFSGTGLNFSLLQEQVGPRGRIIGVDVTDAMLHEATARVAAHGWSNVKLVKSDAGVYVFPPEVQGILSTFALTLVPEWYEIDSAPCDFSQVFRMSQNSRLKSKKMCLAKTGALREIDNIAAAISARLCYKS